jgi:hypothetical protein
MFGQLKLLVSERVFKKIGMNPGEPFCFILFIQSEFF